MNIDQKLRRFLINHQNLVLSIIGHISRKSIHQYFIEIVLNLVSLVDKERKHTLVVDLADYFKEDVGDQQVVVSSIVVDIVPIIIVENEKGGKPADSLTEERSRDQIFVCD